MLKARGSPHALVVLVAVVGVQVGVLGLGLKARDGSHPVADLVFGGFAGFLFIGAGVIAAVRRPGNRVGLLLMLVGTAWFAEDVQFSRVPWVYTIGGLLIHGSSAFGAHLVLAFPSGRLGSTWQRALAASAYAVAFGGPLATALFKHPPSHGLHKPPNLLLLQDMPQVARALVDITNLLGTILAVAIVITLTRRWLAASSPKRQYLAPVLIAGLLGAASTAVGLAGSDSPVGHAGLLVYKVAFCLLPLGFLAGIMRLRVGPTRADGVLLQLGTGDSATSMQQLLARGLGDPSLRLGIWDTDSGSYLDTDGRPLDTRVDGVTRAATPVLFDGRELAVFTHDPVLREDPERLAAVSAGAAVALERERLAADVRESRARIVGAAVQERHRIGRDLHDGAQHQLVIAKLLVRAAMTDLAADDPQHAAGKLAAGVQALDRTVKELRELAQGLHPVILLRNGLGAAVEALADDMTIAVHTDLTGLPRLPVVVESTVHLAVKEALTNVLKHASAGRVTITAKHDGALLRVEIADDGRGGARIADGTGLRGLQDRIAALGGLLTVESPPGGGTTVSLSVPSQPGAPPVAREGECHVAERDAGS